MYIFLLSFTLYYEPAPSTWKAMANSIYPPFCSIVPTRNYVCIQQYIVYLRSCLSSVDQQGPPVVCLRVCKFSRVHLGAPPEWRYQLSIALLPRVWQHYLFCDFFSDMFTCLFCILFEFFSNNQNYKKYDRLELLILLSLTKNDPNCRGTRY